MKKGMLLAGLAVCAMMLAGGCSAKVGSEAWCKKMRAKPRADWTTNETMNYSRYCILKK